MKKVIAIVAALVVVLGVFAACTAQKAPEVKSYEGTIEELVSALYEKEPVEFMLGSPRAVDFADEYSVSSCLGLESADGLKEAICSEPMTGSQAYSLVIARVSDLAKIEELKKAMFEGINPAKWICVEADKLRVVSSGDLIMLVMVSSDLNAELADGMVEAFKTTVGELSGETLSKG